MMGRSNHVGTGPKGQEEEVSREVQLTGSL